MYEYERAQLENGQAQINDPMGVNVYFPDYDWDSDEFNFHKNFYAGDLWLQAVNFWGQNNVYRVPTYSQWQGKQRLGRLMGPDECEIMMRWHRWQYYRLLYRTATFLVLGVVMGVVGGIGAAGAFGGGFGLLFTVPAVLLFFGKGRYFKTWHLFFQEAQAEFFRTNKPVWVPYGKKQLKNVTRQGGRFVWP